MGDRHTGLVWWVSVLFPFSRGPHGGPGWDTTVPLAQLCWVWRLCMSGVPASFTGVCVWNPSPCMCLQMLMVCSPITLHAWQAVHLSAWQEPFFHVQGGRNEGEELSLTVFMLTIYPLASSLKAASSSSLAPGALAFLLLQGGERSQEERKVLALCRAFPNIQKRRCREKFGLQGAHVKEMPVVDRAWAAGERVCPAEDISRGSSGQRQASLIGLHVFVQEQPPFFLLARTFKVCFFSRL